jgi:hypothetical protein
MLIDAHFIFLQNFAFIYSAFDLEQRGLILKERFLSLAFGDMINL